MSEEFSPGSQEYNNSMKFLIEQCEKMKGPVTIGKLNREFERRKDACMAEFCWNKKFRSDIHKLDIDLNTKVRMLYMLSVPINAEFLNQLRKDATVIVDDSNRIIEYKKDGETTLEGKHPDNYKKNPETEKNEKKMFWMMAEEAVKATEPINTEQFLKEFKRLNQSETRSIHWLEKRMTVLKSKIYESEEFNKETKIKMLIWSQARIDDYAFKELQKEAEVELSKYRRITKYISNDGSLSFNWQNFLMAKNNELKTLKWRRISYKLDPNTSVGTPDDTSNKVKTTVAEDEMPALIKFVVEQCRKATYPITTRKMAAAYVRKTKFPRLITCVKSRLREFRKYIHTIDSISNEVKAKIMLVMSIPVEATLLDTLRNDAEVKVDKIGRITVYKAKDGSLKFSKKRERMEPEPWEYEDEEESGDSDSSDSSNSSEKKKSDNKPVVTRYGRTSKKPSMDLQREERESSEDSEEEEEDYDEDQMDVEIDDNEDIEMEEPEEIDSEFVRKSKFLDARRRAKSVANPASFASHKHLLKCFVQHDFSRDEHSLDNSFLNNDDHQFEYDDFEMDITPRFITPKLSKEAAPSEVKHNLKEDIGIVPEAELLQNITTSDLDASFDIHDTPSVRQIPSDIEISDNTALLATSQSLKVVADSIHPTPNPSNSQFNRNQNPSESALSAHSEVGIIGNKSKEYDPSSYTSLTLIFQSIHVLIDTLDLPVLVDLQKIIEIEMEKIKNRKAIISHNIIRLSLELCLEKLVESKAIESSELVSLREFLCHLRHLVLDLKLPSLVEFQEKLKGIIGGLRGRDKMMPVASIRIALHTTINNMITL